MSVDQEERYFTDILPEIGAYSFATGKNSFTASDIAERLAAYSPEEVEDALYSMAEKDEINHIRPDGEEWEFLIFNPEADIYAEGEAPGRNVVDAGEPSAAERLEADVNLEELSSQVYGRLRMNRDELYSSLEKLKADGKNYFDSKDLKKYWDKQKKEIGMVLAGLAAAGLIKKYNDNRSPTLYEADFELEEVKDFLNSTRHAGTLEQLKDMLDPRED